MANHQFHESVKNFRDIIFLQQNLRAWLENIDVYNTMLQARKERFPQEIPYDYQPLSGQTFVWDDAARQSLRGYNNLDLGI